VVGVKIPDKTNFLNVQSLNEHKKKIIPYGLLYLMKPKESEDAEQTLVFFSIQRERGEIDVVWVYLGQVRLNH
jgi:hypothetical protein